MHPDRDTLSNVPRSGYITTRDQNMVESGVTDGGKNTASFLFREWTQQYADSGKKPEVAWKRGLRALIVKMAT